ncbi:helix-turn-helix transcriptional regulator [Streptomyces sp. NPDC048551]|uniref:helix-turn-helix domain-containing protein n=1 Tax=Streptomyces sp. NPDC048551 TaxID=3155758 RepID=UPI00342428BB
MAIDVSTDSTPTGHVLGEDHAAARINIERRHRGWSTTSLSDRLNHSGSRMNPSAVWRIENGKRRIHLDEAIGFAQVFGIALTDLVSPPELSTEAAELIEGLARAERAVQQAQHTHRQASDHLAAYLAKHPDLHEWPGAPASG